MRINKAIIAVSDPIGGGVDLEVVGEQDNTGWIVVINQCSGICGRNEVA
jgi:hypothetical protein